MNEIKNELQQLELNYPQIAKVYDIGDSWEKTQGIANRDILAIKISDNVAQDEGESEAQVLTPGQIFIAEPHPFPSLKLKLYAI